MFPFGRFFGGYGFGRGFGWGFGFRHRWRGGGWFPRWGFGRGFWAKAMWLDYDYPPSYEEQKEFFYAWKDDIEKELEYVNKKINELQKKEEEKSSL